MVTEKPRPEELGDEESGQRSHFALSSGIFRNCSCGHTNPFSVLLCSYKSTLWENMISCWSFALSCMCFLLSGPTSYHHWFAMSCLLFISFLFIFKSCSGQALCRSKQYHAGRHGVPTRVGQQPFHLCSSSCFKEVTGRQLSSAQSYPP